MGKRFDETFDEVLTFEPEGLYVSRNIFTKEAAIEAFSRFMNLDHNILDEQVDEAYVRFGPTCWGLREEIGNMAWLVCEKDTKGAQPCWCFV